MYPSLTLYPNGAFMICESVGEFDENVPQQEAPREVLVDATSNNPLYQMINILRPTYENFYKPLLTMGQVFESNEAAVNNLEFLSHAAQNISDSLRAAIATGQGLRKALDNYEEFTDVSFRANLKLFLNNATRIHQQGIDTMTCTYTLIPSLSEDYQAKNIVALIASAPDILGGIITSNTLAAGNPYDPILKNFEGPIDVAQCVFEQPERFVRLQANNSCTRSFDSIVSTTAYDEHESRCFDQHRSAYCKFLSILSHTLRHTTRMCYELACDLMDGNVSPEMYKGKLGKELNKWVNLFGFGVALAMMCYSRIYMSYEMRKAMDDYTNTLLKTLR